jgi:hypothetical protein
MVLRCFDVYAAADLTGGNVFLRGSAGQTIAKFSFTAYTAGSDQWQGREVIYAGESIEVYSDTIPVDATLSGYLLVD